MKKCILFVIICLVVIFPSYASETIGKYSTVPEGHSKSIPQLGLYLFKTENLPEGSIYTEPDYKMTVQGAGDPEAGNQTYLSAIRMEGVIQNSRKVTIALIDTGIDSAHPDLYSVCEPSCDVNGHGTAMAGIIAAESDNGLGIKGIANAHIIPLNAFDKNGTASYFSVIQGIIEAADRGAEIICIGAGGEYDSIALRDAVEYAYMKGSVIVAAGGNTGTEKLLYPAAYKNVLSAGSVNNEGNPCSAADFGKNIDTKGSCLNAEYMLPGVNIYTTKSGGSYGYYGGTSYSAAILAGLSGYVAGENKLSKDSGIRLEQMRSKIASLLLYGPEEKETAAAAVSSLYGTSVESSEELITAEAPLTAGPVSDIPDGLLTISRDISKNIVLPLEESTVTLTIVNNGTTEISTFTFIDSLSPSVSVSEFSSVSVSGQSASVPLSGSATVDGVSVQYVKGSKIKGLVQYKWAFSSFAAGKTIVIQYTVNSSKNGMYHFNSYSLTGMYDGRAITDFELNGDFVIVELPDIRGESAPAGYITDLNPVFKWKDLGAGFVYQFALYEKSGARLKGVVPKEKELSTNTYSLPEGISLKSGKQYIWQAGAIFTATGKKTTFEKVRIIVFSYGTPYPVEPVGAYYSDTEKPTFKWTKVEDAHHYRIKLMQKSGKTWKKLNEYSTQNRGNNITSVSWSDIARDKYGVEIGNKPGVSYRWEIYALDETENLKSASSSAEFTHYPMSEVTLIKPLGTITTADSKTFTFEWTTNSEAYSYIFNLYKLAGAKKILDKKQSREVVGATTVTATVAALKNYMWEVIPKHATNYQGVKAIGLFTTIPGDPPEIQDFKGFLTSTQPVLNITGGYSDVYVKITLGKSVLLDKTFSGTPTSVNLASEGVTLTWGKTYVISLRGEYANGELYTKTRKYKAKVLLSAPVFSLPESETDSLEPDFEWSAVDGATKYILTVKQGKTVILEKEVTTNTYKYNKDDAGGVELKDGAKYTAVVYALRSDNEAGLKSKSKSFKARAIRAPSITLPDTRTTVNPVISWTESEEAVSYEWMIKLGKKVLAKDTTTETSYNFADSTTEIFVSGKKYQLQVRAQNSSGQFSKAAVKNFTTFELDTPVLISPGFLNKEYQNIITLTPEFKWSEISGYDMYELCIYAGRTKKTYLSYTNSYQLTESQMLKDGQKYSYAVRGKSPSGTSDWSEKRYFTTFKFDSSVLEYPNRKIYVTMPTFVFTIYDEIEYAEILLYKYDSKNRRKLYKKFKAPRYESSNFILYRCPYAIAMNQKYSWCVRAVGVNVKSGYSKFMDFEISSAAAYRHETLEEIFSVVGTMQATDITKTGFTLSWASIEDAVKYHIYRNGIEIGTTSGTSLAVSGLNANTQYSMQVASESSSGVVGAKSPATVVVTLPDAVTGVIGSEQTMSGFTVSWNEKTYAEKYHVYVNGSKYGETEDTGMIISGMASNTKYQIEIAAENESGEGDKSGITEIATLVSAPSGLSVSNISSNSYTLTWPSVNNVTQYYIYLNGERYGAAVTGTSATIAGRAPNTVYVMKVSAIGYAGEGPLSEPKNALTRPGAVAGITATERMSNGFTLEWAAMSNITLYNVYINGVKKTSTASNTATVGGLSANTVYSVSVSAQNSSGEGNQSTPVSIATKVSAPGNVAVNGVSTTGFTVTWNTVPNVSTYKVYINTSLIGSTGTSSYAVTGLTPNTIYSVEVSSMGAGGDEEKSSPVSTITVPDKVSSVLSFLVHKKDFMLTWGHMDNITAYHVLIDGVEKTAPSTNVATITGLNADTTYSVRVSAQNASGTGILSDAITVKTYDSCEMWEQIVSAVPGMAARQGHTAVVYKDPADNKDKIWVIGGYNGTRLNDVWKSADGVNWTLVTSSASFNPRYDHTCFVFNNKLWVIGGNSNSGLKNDVWYSTNGATWTEASYSGGRFAARSRHTSVVYNSKMWVVAGRTSSNVRDVWSSSDGGTWTQVTGSANFSARYNHASVVFDNKMWVINGTTSSDTSGYNNEVWYSTNGSSWTRSTSTASNHPRHGHCAFVHDGKMWLSMGATQLGGYRRDIYYSNAAGSAWVEQILSSNNFSKRTNAAAVVFDAGNGNRVYVIGGLDENLAYQMDVWCAE